MNKVILTGNVGKDPEVRYLNTGVAYTMLSVATSENYRDKDGKDVTRVEWINVALWRALAEFAEKYVKKGAFVYVEGKLSTRKYVDKAGVERSITEVVAEEFKLLNAR